MQELTDDQLDGLFRKSAEEFDPPFDPAAWQAMQARLDEHDRTIAGPPQWRNRLIRWGLPLLLILLLTGSSWYYLSRSSTIKTASNGQQTPTRSEQTIPVEQSAQQTRTPKVAAEPSAKETDNATEAPPLSVLTKQDKEALPGPGSKPEKTSSLSNKQTERVSRGTAKAFRNETHLADENRPGNKPKSTDAPVAVPSATNSISARPARQKHVTRNRRPTMDRSEPKQSELSRMRPTSDRLTARTSAITANPDWTPAEPETATGSQSLLSLTETKSVAQFAVSELRSRTGQWARLTAAINRPVLVRPDTTAQQKVVSKPITERGVSVRFVVSPDLSAVGLKNFARPGTNVGLLLEYRLARRWSVQAGALWSTKVYETSEVPDYTLTWRVIPEGVSGQCSLFDIPINVRYDIHLKAEPGGQVRSRWFISGGATTYIMQQEDYTYAYADPANIHIYKDMRGWHGSTGRYNFSHLNLSAGYERTINRRLSWQAEPFLKVPLQGVGYYQLNLLSTGAFLSLRYKL